MAQRARRPRVAIDRRGARLSAPERRDHFLDVAGALVLEQGVDSVTMEGVAAAAGVSKGLGYAYFANRDELLRVLLERELAELDRRLLAALDDDEDFEGKLRASVRAWFRTIRERGELLGPLLAASERQGGFRRSREDWYRRREELWGELAVEALGAPKREAVAAAAVFLAGMRGVLDRWLLAGDGQRLLEDTYVRVVMGGFRALAGGEDDGHDAVKGGGATPPR